MSATDRDKHDSKQRSGVANATKHIPKDAQVIMSIMKELGIGDYEPRVINQLLEFTYRYVTCILDDAKVYTNHAKKKTIDLDDVRLASQLVLDKAFTNPPPRDVLLEIARGRNIAPLPTIKSHCGLRLPPDRYCLIATNYKLKAAAVPPKKMTKSALAGDAARGGAAKGGAPKAAGAGAVGGGAKRQNVGGAKQQSVSIPKPVFKFSSQAKASAASGPKPPKGAAASSSASSGVGAAGAGGNGIAADGMIKMESDDAESGGAVKRKREEDDFQVVG